MARKKNLKVNITGDSSGLERETRKASGTIDRFVGSAKKSLAGLAAQVGGVIAAFRGFSSVISTLNAFEAANSKLAAVLGTSVKNITNLTNAAMELGRRTQYTASEVTELQTELAKLGFRDTEIIAMQESVLKFAAAVGTDLASAAARAGATMRGFDLTAEQTGDMLAVMAVSTSKSALSFEYLDETLGKVVPVTRAFGLDTRSTVTLLGTLANAGIDASSAGTALRRIFTELANESSKLNKAIGYQPKTMGEVITALQTLRDKGIGVTEAMDMVGKYAGSTFLALVNGADDCRELYGELQDVDTALNDMYATMTDNVEGAIKGLQSAWEGFILKLQNSKGVLRDIIQMSTDVVRWISGEGGFKRQRQQREAEAYANRRMTGEGDISFKGFGGMSDQKIDAYIAKLEADLDHFKREKIWNKARDIEDELAIARLAAPIAKERNFLARNPALAGGNTGTEGGDGDAGDDGDDSKKKKKADGFRELAAAAREYAAEIKEVDEADAAMEAMASQMLAKFQDLHPTIDDSTASLLGLASQVAQLVELNQEYNGALGDITKSLSDMNAESIRLATTMEDELTAAVDEIFEKYDEEFLKTLDAVRNFSESVTSLVHDAISEAFVGFGEFVGNAMTAGLDEAASNLGAGLLDTLGSLAIKVGELAIETGVALSGIKVALDSMNPYVAIAAGAALVALGTAVRNAAGNISRGASAAYSVGASGYSSYNSPEGYAERQLNIRVTGKLTAAPGVLNAVIDSENTRLEHTT